MRWKLPTPQRARHIPRLTQIFKHTPRSHYIPCLEMSRVNSVYRPGRFAHRMRGARCLRPILARRYLLYVSFFKVSLSFFFVYFFLCLSLEILCPQLFFLPLGIVRFGFILYLSVFLVCLSYWASRRLVILFYCVFLY